MNNHTKQNKKEEKKKTSNNNNNKTQPLTQTNKNKRRIHIFNFLIQ